MARETDADNDQSQGRIKVAVIGSGMAGLVSAHLLSRAAFRSRGLELHLFERSSKLGLDAHSISVLDEQDESIYRIDVPMRSFNAGYYPSLFDLYRNLGITIRPSNFTFSFSLSSTTSPWLIYNGQNGLRGLSLPSSIRPRIPSLVSIFSAPVRAITGLWNQFDSVRRYLSLITSLAISYFQLLFFALWHYTMGHCSDPRHSLATHPFRSWCEDKQLSADFIDGVVVSLFSAVMTSQHDTVLSCPASEILTYVATTFLRSHFTVANGVNEVEEALTKHVPKNHIHTSTSVKGVHPSKKGQACLLVESFDDHGDSQTGLLDGFDHVILAAPAHHSATLVESYISSLRASKRVNTSETPRAEDFHEESGDEKNEEIRRLSVVLQKLRALRIEESVVINHTDRSLLPPNRSDWRDLNLSSPTWSEGASESEEDDSFLLGRKSHQLDQKSFTSAFSDTMGSLSATHHESRHTSATHIVTDRNKKGKPLVLQTTNPQPNWMPSSEEVLSASRFQRVMTPTKPSLEGLFNWQRRELKPLRNSNKTSSQHLVKRSFQMIYSLTPVSQWEMKLGELQGGEKCSCSEERSLPSFWFCGSYSYGIPLLEGCVVSSQLVVEELLRREGIDADELSCEP